MNKRILYIIFIVFIMAVSYSFFFDDQPRNEHQIFSNVDLIEMISPYPSFSKMDTVIKSYENVTTDVIYSFEDIVFTNLISDFFVTKNSLYLLVRGAEHPIHQLVFDENNILQHIEFGERGRGPKEFSLPIHFGIDTGDQNNLLIFDQNNRRISILSLAEEDSIAVKEQFLTDFDLGSFFLKDDKIYANGDFFDDKAIVILEKKEREFRQVDAFRNALFKTKNTKFTPAVLVHLNRSSATVHPDARFLAKGYLYIPVIQIYNIKGDLLKEYNFDEDFDLNYEIKYDNRENIDRFIRTKNTKFAYLSLAASSEYIYALFSGRSEASQKENDEAFQYFSGNQIHVLDWSGNIIKKVKLDVNVNRIFFDNHSNRLYGIKLYDDYSLMKFNPF